jgi:Ser/Thr protein kinase RdoA (MazF antagonist)
MAHGANATLTLDRPAGTVAGAVAVNALRHHYGIDAEVTALRGERDTNFLVAVDGVASHVLRIANVAEPRVVGDFRAQALRHVECSAPALPVPRVRPTRDGALGFDLDGPDGTRLGQLVSYLLGTPVASIGDGTRQRRHLGEVAARMALAFRGFDHPGARHALLWDIGQAAQAARCVRYTTQPDQRAMVDGALRGFVDRVVPALGDLRAQVIHNDLNPHNILVSDDGEQVVGIIDFGDIVHSALANDVAVACSYLVGQADDPLAPICDFLAAYCRVLPLVEQELALLPDLIMTRLALTIVITNWRAQLDPDNASYILRNQQGAIQGLRHLSGLGPSRASARFMIAAAQGMGR